MIQYIFSPKWFYGIDIALELFSIVVVFLLARYGYKLYRITKEKNHKYFSIFFLLIGIAFLFKIMANFDIYYLEIESVRIANSIFNFEVSHVSEIMFYIGFTAFKFLLMLAFFGLLYINWKRKRGFILSAYLIGVIALFSNNSYYIFHITMSVFLLELFWTHFKSYMEKGKSHKIMLLTPVSFFMLLISQVAFTAIALNLIMYVIGEIFQLAGFCLLLYEYFMVIYYEK